MTIYCYTGEVRQTRPARVFSNGILYSQIELFSDGKTKKYSRLFCTHKIDKRLQKNKKLSLFVWENFVFALELSNDEFEVDIEGVRSSFFFHDIWLLLILSVLILPLPYVLYIVLKKLVKFRRMKSMDAFLRTQKQADQMKSNICVTCGDRDYKVLIEAKIPPISQLDFSARLPKNNFHPRYVKCLNCGQIYANPYFNEELVSALYRDSAFINERQLQNMAADYFSEFKKIFGDTDPSKLKVLEIACGNGFFLKHLLKNGISEVTGIEPSKDAVKSADLSVKEHIRCEFFEPKNLPENYYDVVCCFQLLDHLLNPSACLEGIRSVLKENGILLNINHNIQSPLTRLLGKRSPMFDIEHVYLFDNKTICKIMERHGFSIIENRNISNKYNIPYLMKMFTVLGSIKIFLAKVSERLGFEKINIFVPAGNMITIATKRQDKLRP